MRRRLLTATSNASLVAFYATKNTARWLCMQQTNYASPLRVSFYDAVQVRTVVEARNDFVYDVSAQPTTVKVSTVIRSIRLTMLNILP
jgi:hypothetical protein